MVKDLETTTRRYTKKSLMAFLDGEKNLNWITEVIKSSGITGEKLQQIFNELRDYGDNERYLIAHQKCEKEEML